MPCPGDRSGRYRPPSLRAIPDSCPCANPRTSRREKRSSSDYSRRARDPPRLEALVMSARFLFVGRDQSVSVPSAEVHIVVNEYYKGQSTLWHIPFDRGILRIVNSPASHGTGIIVGTDQQSHPAAHALGVF